MSVRLASRQRLAAVALSFLAIVALSGCAESLAEFGLEQVIEANVDGDVDLDFSDTGLSIQSDDGNLDFSFDEDSGTGSFVFESDDGSGTVTFDDEGNVVYDTDQGSGTATFDGETMRITDETQGEIAIAAADSDGGGTITSDSMQAAFGLTAPPENWPSEIGVPATFDPSETTYSQIEQGDQTILTANFSHDPSEDFATAVIEQLTSDGWTSDLVANQDGGVYAQLSNGDRIALVLGDGTGITSITLQLN